MIRMRRWGALSAALLMFTSLTAVAEAAPDGDRSGVRLVVSWDDPAVDPATGQPRTPLTGEYFYQRFSTRSYVFQAGDRIAYDVRFANPSQGLGGLDVQLTDGTNLRDQPGWTDQKGLSGHPSADLRDVAYQQWYHRVLTVPAALAGKTAAAWKLAADLPNVKTANQGKGTAHATETVYSAITVTDAAGVARPGGVIFGKPADVVPGPIEKLGALGGLELANATQRPLSGTVVTPAMRFPPADREAVASVDATAAPYNAPRDGSDASTVVQKALDDVYDQGGGTVYLPSGRYGMAKNLVVRAGVTLAGDWKAPSTWAQRETGDLGTVLAVTAGEGNENAQPFLRLAGSISGGSVTGLSIWYPNQTVPNSTDAAAVKKYPWTISQDAGTATSVERVTLVNAYRGLDLHSLASVRQVYGAPLMTGVRVTGSYDVNRLRDMDLSYHFWARSGLPGAPDQAGDAAVLRWKVNQPTVGISFADTDGQYLSDVAIDGFATGVEMVAAPDGSSRAFWGLLSGLHVEDTMVALRVDRLSANAGGSITGSVLHGWLAAVRMNVEAATDPGNKLFYDKPFSISSSTLGAGAGPAVEVNGNAALVLDTDVVDRWAGGPAVEVRNGSVAVEHTDFTQAPSGPVVRLGGGVHSATVLDDGFATAPDESTVESAQGLVPGRIEVDGLIEGKVDAPAPPITLSPPDESRYRPASGTLYDVRLPLSGCTCPVAASNGRTDDTAAIQSRLDYAGAHGGGTVYLPGGHYLLSGVLKVSAGVELRGAVDAPQYADARGTILFTTHQGDTPFITLAGGGVRGLKVFWPDQGHTADKLIQYPWAISGSGPRVHVVNVTLVNAYRGVRFEDGADEHFVRSLYGLVLAEGIAVGRTAHGRLEDTHFIRTAWTYSQLTRELDTVWASGLKDFSLGTFVAYRFTGTTDEQLLGTFAFEAQHGYVADAASVTSVNAGMDQSGGASFQVGAGSTARFRNLLATGFTGPGADYVAVTGGNSQFEGVLLWQTNDPAKGISVSGDGDTGVVLGAGVMTSGSIHLAGGTADLRGLLLRPDPVVADPGTVVTIGEDVAPGTAVGGTIQGRGVAIDNQAGDRVPTRGNVTR